ncbi:divergent polysaccharide deacetylase family protein [uncultured Paraglaciecola sp.]|uniref:divergent polysaccharide deacetylase family protein n=1 Tax=uncultured Paraglaciecola sp. TaxID=1765024 RepID=UPI0030DCAFAF|tara:strand:- start:5954 stop:6718 length:765 start_codon:yes stop_codon:yes gene_type:complete
MRLFLICCLLSISFSASASQIALIIDDMGNTKQDAQAFTLPANVTFAILPNKPLSKTFSNRAAAQQREVILHMPMESLAGNNQEKNVLLSTMAPNQIVQTLKTALSTVPHAVGVNNHMGSRLTQLTLPMSVTMEFLSERGLFFVDSRTTRYSKAEIIAKKNGVLSTKRNVFIDHTPSLEQIDKQFNRLLSLSKKFGYAVGIAHPYPQTLEYLKTHLVTLQQHGITLVKMSDVVSSSASYAYHPKDKPEPISPAL